MYIDRLRLKNFRNYSDLEIEFCPGINFITGNNGAGKTSILEAVSVLSGLKSFRNISDSEIIKWGKDSYYCSASVNECNNNFFEVGCAFLKNSLKKKAKIDSEVIKRASDYYGILLTVIFSPSDINIINGSPDLRRKFFDSVFSKIDPSYFISLSQYRHILKARNQLLKKMRDAKKSSSSELDVWDDMLTSKAVEILTKRNRYLNDFSDLFEENYKTIYSQDSDIKIDYKTDCRDLSLPVFNRNLVNNRKKDILSGTTTSGPHRDDYLIQNSSGKRFTLFASQGQKRLASISLKIAENTIIERMREKKTIILVDDIFSELDKQKRNSLLQYFKGDNQIIFSMIDDNWSKINDKYIKKFKVENFKIVE